LLNKIKLYKIAPEIIFRSIPFFFTAFYLSAPKKT